MPSKPWCEFAMRPQAKVQSCVSVQKVLLKMPASVASQLVEQLQSVSKMAGEVLRSLNQRPGLLLAICLAFLLNMGTSFKEIIATSRSKCLRIEA